MLMEEPSEVNPPSGRVPGQVLQAILKSESRRRWNRKFFRVTGLYFGVFWTRAKYRPKGDLGGAPLAQAGAWAGGGPPPALLRASGVFRLGYFLGISPEFSEHFYF